MAKKDFYDTLGISKSASSDEIKSAYRKLARKLHPDATKNDPKSTERFKEVQEAYEVLSDQGKRKNYDEFGHAGVGASAGAGADPFDAFRRAQRGNGAANPQWGPGAAAEGFDFGSSGGGDMGSIFEQLFGGGGGGRAKGAGRGRQRAARRGEDVEHPVTLTFEQAARGVHLPLQINRDGRLETIDIKVPSGVKDGSRVRIRGKGQIAGGEPGDLFIVTTVQPHPYFRRDGLDIYVDVPVSLYEALLGAKVQVPTLDGKLTLTIPPGTTGGARLRIKGKGVVRADEQGDQFVVVKIVLPKQLEEADRLAVEQLSERHPIDARADVAWK